MCVTLSIDRLISTKQGQQLEPVKTAWQCRQSVRQQFQETKRPYFAGRSQIERRHSPSSILLVLLLLFYLRMNQRVEISNTTKTLMGDGIGFGGYGDEILFFRSGRLGKTQGAKAIIKIEVIGSQFTMDLYQRLLKNYKRPILLLLLVIDNDLQNKR